MNIKELFTTKPSSEDCPIRTYICVGVFVALLVVMFVPADEANSSTATTIQR
jgi:hypothetical protein